MLPLKHRLSFKQAVLTTAETKGVGRCAIRSLADRWYLDCIFNDSADILKLIIERKLGAEKVSVFLLQSNTNTNRIDSDTRDANLYEPEPIFFLWAIDAGLFRCMDDLFFLHCGRSAAEVGR